VEFVAKTSSGARAVLVDVEVGRADSSDALATLETEEMVALGWRSGSERRSQP
jgi:hypothetical protein